MDKAVKRLATRVYRKEILLKLDIDPNQPFYVRDPKIPITVRQAHSADLIKFQAVYEKFQSRYSPRLEDFVRLLHSNDVGFVALSGEEIAAYAWMGIGPTQKLDRLGIHLTPQDAYMHTAYTAPQFRRQGLHTHLNGYRIRWAQEQNCLRVYVLVATSNIASLRSWEATGSQKIAHLTFLGLPDRELVRHRRIEPGQVS